MLSLREREIRGGGGENYITDNLIILDIRVTKYNLGHQINGVEMGEHVACMKI